MTETTKKQRRERLKAMMAEHQLSVTDIADAGGYSPSTVYGWLNGSANLPRRNLELLELKLQKAPEHSGVGE